MGLESLRVSRFIALIGLTLGLCGCTREPLAVIPGQQKTALRPLVLQLNWFPEAEHGGFFAALVEGGYEAQGLSVEIRPGGRSTQVVADLATGRATFAVTNAEDVVLARNQGADIVTVMAACQHHPRCIMVRTDSGVKSLQELRGLTLQAQPGQPYLQFLRKRGLLEGVREVPYNGTVAQTVSDKKMAQQAYVYSEPLLARQAGAEVTTLMLSDLGFDPYSSVLVTTGDTIRKQPDLVRKMVAASIQGWQKYLAEPSAANNYILQQNPEGISAEALTYGVEMLRDMCLPDGMSVNQLGQMTAERWTLLVQQMLDIDQELSAERVKASECYRLEFLPH